jgi:hypothetical protein
MRHTASPTNRFDGWEKLSRRSRPPSKPKTYPPIPSHPSDGMTLEWPDLKEHG